jgi:hypothetical protein
MRVFGISLMTLIKAISVDSDNTYGRRRIHFELTELGHEIGVYKTVNLMEKLNIKAIRPKKRHYYPLSGKEYKYALKSFLVLIDHYTSEGKSLTVIQGLYSEF